MITYLHPLPNGDFIDYGRNWRRFGLEGYGPARVCMGEAAEVMRLVLKYTKGQ